MLSDNALISCIKIILYLNYRSSLNDCKLALKLKSNYTKALNRAATCCLYVKDYDNCIDFCDQLLDESPTDKIILHLKSQAVAARVRYI